jgi:hypothetical protein
MLVGRFDLADLLYVQRVTNLVQTYRFSGCFRMSPQDQ